MNSPREILISLRDAAFDLESQLPPVFERTAGLKTAVAALNAALESASEELNRSHQLVAFVGNGRLANMFADVDMNVSCMVVNFDTDGHDPTNPDLAEITWSRSQTKSGMVLTDHQPCEVDPVLVNDVARVFDELRIKALSSLKHLKRPTDA